LWNKLKINFLLHLSIKKVFKKPKSSYYETRPLLRQAFFYSYMNEKPFVFPSAIKSDNLLFDDRIPPHKTVPELLFIYHGERDSGKENQSYFLVNFFLFFSVFSKISSVFQVFDNLQAVQCFSSSHMEIIWKHSANKNKCFLHKIIFSLNDLKCLRLIKRCKNNLDSPLWNE